MRLEVFTGRDLSAVCAQARTALGEDALITRTRSLHDGSRTWIEVEAAAADDIARLRRLLEPRGRRMRPMNASGDERRPYIVALVGPTGAGKTTTLAKLAVHPGAFGSLRVGFLTLDTYRAGAYEQLHAYAEAVGLPCEMAYDRTELMASLKRLSACDVVLVDTPGRGPRSGAMAPMWRSLLKSVNADETHLVVPATMRRELVTRLRAEYSTTGLTHTILTKLDEVPADGTLAAMVVDLDLDTRWITDGQDVPDDLRAASPVVLGALGFAPLTAAAV